MTVMRQHFSHVRHPVAASHEYQIIPSNKSALVTFSQAGSDTSAKMFTVIQPIPNQTGVNPWQLQYPLTYPQSVLKKLFNWLLNEHEKLCTISTRNGSKCSAPSTSCDAKPCQYCGKKQRSTQLQRADASPATRT